MTMVDALVYALMFLAAIMLLEGGWQLASALRKSESRAINRRLRLLDSGYDPEEIYRLLRRNRDDAGWYRLPVIRWLHSFLQQAGVTASLKLVVAGLIGASLVVGGLLMVVLRQPPTLAFGLGPLIVVAIGLLQVALRRKRRLAALEAQLPEMLDLVVRSVRSGHPLNTALKLAADEMPEPLGSEIGLLVDETTYGASLVEAVNNLADRIGKDEFKYFAVVVTITSKSGGNLAAVLSGLSGVMRERVRLRRKIMALSAEGRISGMVMSMAPIALGGLIMLVSSEFYMDIAHDDLFIYIVAIVIFLTLLNMVLLRKLVKFDF